MQFLCQLAFRKILSIKTYNKQIDMDLPPTAWKKYRPLIKCVKYEISVQDGG
jgi:hypothetical protein